MTATTTARDINYLRSLLSVQDQQVQGVIHLDLLPAVNYE